MGQYHIAVNIDKQEWLNPHDLGDGAKLLEQALSGPGGLVTAIHVLLAVSNGRGGGDYGSGSHLTEQVVGRWGGDRIAIVGDYYQPSDLPVEHPNVYRLARDEWENITPLVREYLSDGVDDYYHAFTYEGDFIVKRKFELIRREGR